MGYELEIILIAFFTALSCSLMGLFWVLEKNAYLSDAIGHSVLLGVVLVFLMGFDPFGIWGSVGSILSAFACMAIILAITSKRRFAHKRLPNDAAIMLTMGSFFAVSILLITKFASSVHLDEDTVLLGELIFSAFDRVILNGQDFGPKSFYKSFLLFFVNGLFVLLFFKELKMASFDSRYLRSIGRKNQLLQAGRVVLTAITTMLAINIFGVVLSVSFFVAPVATVYLFRFRRLEFFFFPMVIFLAIHILLGYWLSYKLNVSVAGSMVSVMLAGFLACLLMGNSLFQTGRK